MPRRQEQAVDQTGAVDAGDADGADAGAFVEHLYRRHWTAVVNYIRFRVEPSVAEDLAADVFTRAWAQREQFDPRRGTAEMWMWGIVRNAVSDHRRRATPPAADPMSAARGSEDVQDLVDTRLSLLALADAMARLADTDREIVSLRLGAGLTNGEIGELLGLSKGAVAVRLHRAVRRLRRLADWSQTP